LGPLQGHKIQHFTSNLGQIENIYSISALGPIQGHKIQHFTSNLGQIENIYSISALTPSVKPLGADFNFCTNRSA
jgi:hypothetical protein